ncbi:MAG: pilus assembly protein TadG-related protein [Dehalococcoidia bacterium]
MDRLAEVLRRLWRGESGQTLIITAFALTALVGFAALVLDIGNLYVNRRQLQTGADAAALAGAQLLPSASDASAEALDYAGRNGYASGVTTTTPYNGDSSKIEVEVGGSVQTFLARVLGINSMDVSARAVAVRTLDLGYVLFQSDPDCDEELEIEGDDIYIDGGVHADGELEVDGDDITVTGSVTYVCELDDIDGTNIIFGSGPTQLPAPVPPPLTFSYSDFGSCDFILPDDDDKISFSSTPQYFQSPGVLEDGVYCSNDDIELEDSNVSGNVTFVAQDEIEIEGSNVSLAAYHSSGVVMFAGGFGGDASDPDPDDVGEIEIEGSNTTWVGYLIAPNGEIELEGSNLSSSGTYILAMEIELEGSNITLTGSGVGATAMVSLVE